MRVRVPISLNLLLLVYFTLLTQQLQNELRFFSSADVPAKKAAGPGLFQRLSSFLVGAGLTALGTHFFILDEVRKGNMLMIEKQAEIEKRLEKLEKKK